MARPRIKLLFAVGLAVLGALTMSWYTLHNTGSDDNSILAARYPSPDLLASTDNTTLSYPTAVALHLTPGTKMRVLHKNKSAGGHNWQHELSKYQRHLNHVSSSATNYATQVGSDNATLSEIETVLTRLSACLESTNMSDFFKNNGYYTRAQRNARLVLEDLRKVIPRFGTRYEVPCWKTSFVAVRESPLQNRLHGKPAQNVVSGSIGGFNFSHGGNYFWHKFTLDVVHWSDNNPFHSNLSYACLPKLFLLGYPKCGSSFLYCILLKLLALTLNVGGACEARKEPHWWVNPGRRKYTQSLLPDSLAIYLLNFDRGAEFVAKSLPAVTIDASPNLMFQWPRYFENDTMENYCLIPSLIPVLLPDSKYFVIMRNPVSMLYSTFWFSCTYISVNMNSVKYKGPDIFHERIVEKIGIFNKCKARGLPLDKCMDVASVKLSSPDLPSCGTTRLEIALYYVHTRKWLSVVPRERIHFFTLEELITVDLTHTAKMILDFLEIPMTDDSYNFQDIVCNENKQEKIDYKRDPRLQMREDTRQILEEFFQPYNQMLADLLDDDKFLWKD